jgi:hypothetical protein
VWEKKQKRTGGPWRVSGAGGSLLTSGWERPWWAPGRWRGSGHEAPGAIRSVARAPLARGRPGGGARAAASGRRRGEGSGRARACLFALGGGGARHVTPSRARRSKWAGGGGQATLLCAACARPRPHARTQSKQQRRRAGRPVLGGWKTRAVFQGPRAALRPVRAVVSGGDPPAAAGAVASGCVGLVKRVAGGQSWAGSLAPTRHVDTSSHPADMLCSPAVNVPSIDGLSTCFVVN